MIALEPVHILGQENLIKQCHTSFELCNDVVRMAHDHWSPIQWWHVNEQAFSSSGFVQVLHQVKVLIKLRWKSGFEIQMILIQEGYNGDVVTFDPGHEDCVFRSPCMIAVAVQGLILEHDLVNETVRDGTSTHGEIVSHDQ